MHPDTAAKSGIVDEDWVWVSSRIGRVKGQVKLVHGVNKDTVWTWNAIGKKKGAWGLSPDAPESERGFLLNHLIDELMPPRSGGDRYSNSDPVTGQAAWFDLRVKVEKCSSDEIGKTEPQYPAQASMPNAPERPDVLRYGAELKGTPVEGSVPAEDWIAHRKEVARNVPGMKKGHYGHADKDGGSDT